MEMVVYSPNDEAIPRKIEWNYAEIKSYVAEKMEYYKGLVYTEDAIKVAKKDRADLNRFATAIESRRKEMKKKCLEAYSLFEAEVKDVLALVEEPVRLIDEQIKAAEETERQKKLAQLQEFFNAENDIDRFTLKFEQIFDKRWLNSTVSLQTACGQIREAIAKVKRELQTIDTLPEFAYEALEEYSHTLDLGYAIAEGKRLADIQKRKEEAAQRSAEPQPEPQPQPEPEPKKKAPAASWITFRAYLTAESAKALCKFLQTNDINYEIM